MVMQLVLASPTDDARNAMKETEAHCRERRIRSGNTEGVHRQTGSGLVCRLRVRSEKYSTLRLMRPWMKKVDLLEVLKEFEVPEEDQEWGE